MIEVSGGLVEVKNDNTSLRPCINATGGNSKITVSGGSVISRLQENAICLGGQSSAIDVKGGFIFSCGKQTSVADNFDDYEKPVTRAEMAFFFASALPEMLFAPQNTVIKLPDVDGDAQYGAQIMALYRAGVLAGSDEAGSFNPDNNITRAEAAAIISRVALPKTRISGRMFG